MNPIRPGFPPSVQTPPSQNGQPRLQGGSAIFALARAQHAALAGAAVEPAAQPAATPSNPVAKASEEPPAKILRPGSLIDIRV